MTGQEYADQEYADALHAAIKNLSEVLRDVKNAGLDVVLTADPGGRTNGAKISRTFVAYNPDKMKEK